MANIKKKLRPKDEPRQWPVSSVGIIGRIWDEGGGMPPAVAAYILQLKFSEADIARMHGFSERSGLGTITKEELAEWDEYLTAGAVMTVLQSKARMALKRATPAQVTRG